MNPGILAVVLEAWSGCIPAGWGSDLWLSAVVLWNSAPHVSTMLRSNLDLSDLVLDILQCFDKSLWLSTKWYDKNIIIYLCHVTVPEIWRLHLQKQEESSSNKHQNKWFLLGNLRTNMQLDKTCLMTWNNHLKSVVFCISFSSRQLHM